MKRTPLRRVGISESSVKKALHRKNCRAVVAAQSYGRCSVMYCQGRGDEWHHIWGRRNIIQEPLASNMCCTAMLCCSHHRDVHAKPVGDLAMGLKLWSANHLWARFDPWDRCEPWHIQFKEPVEVVRFVERWLDENYLMETLWNI